MTEPLIDLISKLVSLATSRRQLLTVAAASTASALTGRTRATAAQDYDYGSVATPVDPDETGALVRTSANGAVGVLLDEFPEAMRDTVAADVMSKSQEWWIERARQQLYLVNYRLIYRYYFYEEEKHNLPLPPVELWNISIDPAGPVRTSIDGHDLVVADYAFTSTILTDAESPGYSEPALAVIGGTWDETFVLPVDPTLIVQRTGYACMDEAQYPPETVSAEAAGELYDDSCGVETPGEPLCHFTEPYPTESCVDAVSRAVGHVDTAVRFERIPWDPAEADRVRLGVPTTLDTADLKVVSDETGLGLNHVIYRYFGEDHCALVEGCIGGSGWRRLINFNARTHNVGGGAMVFGELDYENEGFATELIDHHVYQLATCHGHYHFQHYGLFAFDAPGAMENRKNGFCIESTDRLSNNETTPLHSEYSCANQGTPSGWGDLYISSIVCNWVDVTDVDTSAGPLTADLSFEFNPEGFLCEGNVVVDASGATVWEETLFTTADGETVSRPVCETTPGSGENNRGSAPVTLPVRGGMVSQPCQDDQILGPLRNCGFTYTDSVLTCTSGDPVTVSCMSVAGAVPQIVRLCETSQVLGTGVDCSHIDALANVVLEGDSVQIELTCPGPRDASEPGGAIAVYSGAVHTADPGSEVVCTVMAS